MPAAAKGARTQRELSEMAGVSTRSIREWEKEGVDVQDPVALMQRATGVRERAKANEDMADVKLRKLKAEADLKEHELAVEQGKYVSHESQLAAGMKMGMVIRGMMLKMSSDLTPILAGRPAGEIKKALDKYAREKLVELSQYDSPIEVPAD